MIKDIKKMLSLILPCVQNCVTILIENQYEDQGVHNGLGLVRVGKITNNK